MKYKVFNSSRKIKGHTLRNPEFANGPTMEAAALEKRLAGYREGGNDTAGHHGLLMERGGK